ncbi:MAG: YciI family protein [Aggregatilineales bacterium]
MHFVILCEDKDDSLALRQETHDIHLEHIKAYDAQVIAGGPTLTDDDEPTANGTVIIVDMPDRAAVEKFVADDPYSKAGLFKNVIIKPFSVSRMPGS